MDTVVDMGVGELWLKRLTPVKLRKISSNYQPEMHATYTERWMQSDNNVYFNQNFWDNWQKEIR